MSLYETEFNTTEIYDHHKIDEIVKAKNKKRSGVMEIVHNCHPSNAKEMGILQRWIDYFKNLDVPYVAIKAQTGTYSIFKLRRLVVVLRR